jgi:hypothetical protein
VLEAKKKYIVQRKGSSSTDSDKTLQEASTNIVIANDSDSNHKSAATLSLQLSDDIGFTCRYEL